MRNGSNLSFVDGLCRPFLWRVHLECLMDAVTIVVLEVLCQNPTQMSSIEDSDPVQTLSANAPFRSLRVRIQPGAMRRGQHLLVAHVFHALPKPISIDSVPVP